MQTPTGHPAQPIPRPRPHGPADLGILAEDLDRLAGVHPGSRAPELETGLHAYGQVGTSNSSFYDADSDSGAATESDAAPAGPVFVDASGRRRKVARRAGLVALAAVAGYAGLLAMSFAGGPIPPNALLPVPGMPSEKAPASSSVAQDGAATAPASSSGAGHSTTAGRSGNPASDRRTGGSKPTAGAPGQTLPSTPQATSPGSAAPPAPTPTPTSTGASATTSATSHGNPTPPGHQRKSSAPSPTG